MNVVKLDREFKTDDIETVSLTYRCSAGLERTLDIRIGQELDTIDNFVAFDSEYLDLAFIPECKDCKVAKHGLRLDEDRKGHILKMCTLTKVKKIEVEFID